MSGPVVDATELVIEYTTKHGPMRALDEVTLRVEPDQIVALVGESGSGKTTLGMAAGRLLAANAAHIGGALTVAGTTVYQADADIDGGRSRHGDPVALRLLRRDLLGFVFQNPVAALNPTMRIERQLELAAGSAGRSAGDAGQVSANERDGLRTLLADVGLRDVSRVLRSYPHELSGGMAQRVGIAMALQRRPRLLVADEPTAAVDATLRAQILTLLVSRCRESGCALLLLTHDLRAVAEHTERVAVMYGGRVVEQGPTAEVLSAPMHPYTRALVSALPGEERREQRLAAIPGVPPVLRGASPGCAFASRCPEAMVVCEERRPEPAEVGSAGVDGRRVLCHLHAGQATGEQTTRPSLGQAGFRPTSPDRRPTTGEPVDPGRQSAGPAALCSTAGRRVAKPGRSPDEPAAVPNTDRAPVASAGDVVVTYRSGHGRQAASVHALNGVSLDILAGQTVGLVGESGSGKTTLGRVLLGLVKPSSGQVRFLGRPVTDRRVQRRLRGRTQVVLQNPDWSLNPALPVWRSVAEPLVITGTGTRRDRRTAVEEILTSVGLAPDLAARHPHELSGGQRQRVAIARAIITDPDLIVFDEAVTALDVSVQTQTLNLIRDLQAERGFAALFISHDIAAVRYVADHIAVAHEGRLVDHGPVEQFYGEHPRNHPYTRRLLAALPMATQPASSDGEHAS